MAYSDKVLDHYENPRNVGRLDDSTTVWKPARAKVTEYEPGGRAG